jgi:hypothetical protein
LHYVRETRKNEDAELIQKQTDGQFAEKGKRTTDVEYPFF